MNFIILLARSFAIYSEILEGKRKLQLKEYFPNPTQYVINKVVGDRNFEFLGVFDTIKLEASWIKPDHLLSNPAFFSY